MQAGLTASDRKLLWGAGFIAVLLAIVTVVLAPVEDQARSPVPSTYSSDAKGARAAYLLLADLGFKVQRWEDRPALLPSGVRNLLIVLDPTELPSEGDRKALLEFVSDGGRVLFAGVAIELFFPEAKILPALVSEPREFSSSMPSYLSRGATKLEMQPVAYWSGVSASQFSIYGGSYTPVVVEWRIGEGAVIWWAAATPLVNSGISRAANLQLFLNTVSGGQQEPVEIYWDEYFHGQRASLWNYVERTPLTWALAQLAVIFAAVLFAFSRRSTPIAIPPIRSRLSPLEFLDTMGGLYQRAGATAIAVRVSYRHLRLALARRLGMPAAIPDEMLAQMAEERLGLSAAQLGKTLENAAQAAGAVKLGGRRTLALVQDLEQYTLQLRNPRPITQEKN